ncbi:type I 3-dehydroquinate dehydratase [Candidatus Bathyarchaeota archaeon]|nr:type I 3-dehydroquinate dehydratase [Candidatus Bathyarchaeota archaeon]
MARPRICVVITAPDSERAVKAVQRVLPHEPDLIEIRLDYMEDVGEMTGIREATDLPLIATNRIREQRGLWEGPETKRIEALVSACEEGYEYVDVELTTGSIERIGDEVKALGAKLVVSHHDFDATPGIGELEGIMQRELDAGADICKIVGTARDHGDELTYLRFILENPDVNLVSFGMGEAGLMSRIFSPLFGGAYTYASSGAGDESIPGQLEISELRSIYKILGV